MLQAIVAYLGAPSQSLCELCQQWHKQSLGEGMQGSLLSSADGCGPQSFCFLITPQQQQCHPESKRQITLQS